MQYVWLYVYGHCVVLRVTEHTDCSYSVEANSCLASQDVPPTFYGNRSFMNVFSSTASPSYPEPVNALPSYSRSTMILFPPLMHMDFIFSSGLRFNLCLSRRSCACYVPFLSYPP